MAEQIGGLSVEHIIENACCDTIEERAALLHEFDMAAYAVLNVFEREGATAELVALAGMVQKCIAGLSLLDDGTVTLDRECGTCSGRGSYRRGDASVRCEDCHGSGIETNEEQK